MPVRVCIGIAFSSFNLLFVTLESLTRKDKEVSLLRSHKYVPALIPVGTADGGTMVKVLCYKSEGRWFNSRWCHWNFSLA
jgi:hypothetical protein